MKFTGGLGFNMDLWILALIPLGGLSAWQLYRQYKKSGKVSKLILAQLSAFVVVYLLLDLLERRGLVAGRTMDYLSMGVVALFVIIGSALTGAAVRRAEERKKKMTAGKTPLKQHPARNKSKTATAKKSALKSKKKKG
jgi:hypothetical protein